MAFGKTGDDDIDYDNDNAEAESQIKNAVICVFAS